MDLSSKFHISPGKHSTKTPNAAYVAELDFLRFALKQSNASEKGDLKEQKSAIITQIKYLQDLGLIPIPARPMKYDNVKTIASSFDERPYTIGFPYGPMTGIGFIVKSDHQDQVDATYILVIAGSLCSDPGQGVILVDTIQGTSHEWNLYKTPKRKGAAIIHSLIGNRIVVQLEDGSRMYLDLQSNSFVEEKDGYIEIIPRPTAACMEAPAYPYPTSVQYPFPEQRLPELFNPQIVIEINISRLNWHVLRTMKRVS